MKLHRSVVREKILNKYGFKKEMQELVAFALSVWEPPQSGTKQIYLKIFIRQL